MDVRRFQLDKTHINFLFISVCLFYMSIYLSHNMYLNNSIYAYILSLCLCVSCCQFFGGSVQRAVGRIGLGWWGSTRHGRHVLLSRGWAEWCQWCLKILHLKIKMSNRCAVQCKDVTDVIFPCRGVDTSTARESMKTEKRDEWSEWSADFRFFDTSRAGFALQHAPCHNSRPWEGAKSFFFGCALCIVGINTYNTCTLQSPRFHLSPPMACSLPHATMSSK